jgi:hypothetical protein
VNCVCPHLIFLRIVQPVCFLGCLRPSFQKRGKYLVIRPAYDPLLLNHVVP